MIRSRDAELVPVDLILGLLLTVAAVIVSVVPVPTALSVLVGVPFLLFVPGYAVTAALFPRIRDTRDGDDGLSPLGRVAFSVATSVALAVIVGVNLEFTRWAIEAQSVVGALALVTLAGSIVGALRRARLPASPSGNRSHSMGDSNSSTVATVMVVIAVVVSLASVAVVAGMNDRGEQYTEFGLLVEDESGNLTADEFPSTLPADEATTLHYTITNREQQSETYTVVVRVETVTDDGGVGQAQRLGTYEEPLAPGETVTREHTVGPTMTGEDLRLRYLLYRSDPPADPTGAEAYRTLHLWVDVTDTIGGGGVGTTDPGANESVTAGGQTNTSGTDDGETDGIFG